MSSTFISIRHNRRRCPAVDDAKRRFSTGPAGHAAHLQLLPWTADTPEQWDKLIDAKVDAIISDDPAALIAYLKKRNLH
jgi:hypothetical protein